MKPEMCHIVYLKLKLKPKVCTCNMCGNGESKLSKLVTHFSFIKETLRHFEFHCYEAVTLQSSGHAIATHKQLPQRLF